ncbi:cation diffusion facilitator family transporter [Chryseobacterium gotjawalense]|uniref:Cation diffusion facilitator family transporter n=1 Tax=Chryseobacterium gotjawalense TaxID=3042315 RepID=A0ABY8REY6_9FLAO|nr:cation diffusion facilitator family transporter [Chryseobacterium sp. wdc7]WHF52094.1 cation diffusion facilitator family transporter [Chryseobacterium sp. wdc7]
MAHNHSHDHSHQMNVTNLNRAFYIGIGLNLVFVIVEAGYGWMYNSLSLLSDAGHNLSDVMSLVLSLIAFKLVKRKPTSTYTYGFRRATILASLINAVLLIFAVGFIIYEAVGRFMNPQPLEGGVVSVVAFVGIFVNGITAWLFLKDKEKDLNVKGAYLHMVADALVSLAVVIGGIIIIYTNWFWLDALLSILIGVVILAGTWSLLTQSLKLSLDGVPENINPEKVKQEILKINGVEDFQHVHIWALSTTENALTGHVRISDKLTIPEIENLKETIKHELEHLQIKHSTIETYFGEKHFEEDVF